MQFRDAKFTNIRGDDIFLRELEFHRRDTVAVETGEGCPSAGSKSPLPPLQEAQRARIGTQGLVSTGPN